MYLHDVVNWSDFDDQTLSFYRAISVDMIQLDLRTGGKVEAERHVRAGKDSTGIFEQAREKTESHGLKLQTVFMPVLEGITLATEERDEELGAFVRLIECIGKAGIPTLAWNFKPMGNFRTTSDIGRGGAVYSTFDYAEFDRNRPQPHVPPVSAEVMWENMVAFMRRRGPGGRKGRGNLASTRTTRQYRSLWAASRRSVPRWTVPALFDAVASANQRMLFCQGCMTELAGPKGVYDIIAEMASRKKIALVHFRNVRGRLPRFAEVFIDEGEVDMRRAMETYRDNGYSGPFGMDHTPGFPQSMAGPAGKAYANGYIRAMIQTVYGR